MKRRHPNYIQTHTRKQDCMLTSVISSSKFIKSMIIRRNFNTLLKRQCKSLSRKRVKKKEEKNSVMIKSEFVQLLCLYSRQISYWLNHLSRVFCCIAQRVVEFVAVSFFKYILEYSPKRNKTNWNEIITELNVIAHRASYTHILTK